MTLKRCGCGQSFTRRQLLRLKTLAFQAWPGGLLLVFATCTCGSTLVAVLAGPGQAGPTAPTGG